MSTSTIMEPRKRGRPRTYRTQVVVKLLPYQLSGLDQWRKQQPDAPSRPEAIRRIMEGSLNEGSTQAKD
jgi:hypothetical protein